MCFESVCMVAVFDDLIQVVDYWHFSAHLSYANNKMVVQRSSNWAPLWKLTVLMCKILVWIVHRIHFGMEFYGSNDLYHVRVLQPCPYIERHWVLNIGINSSFHSCMTCAVAVAVAANDAAVTGSVRKWAIFTMPWNSAALCRYKYGKQRSCQIMYGTVVHVCWFRTRINIAFAVATMKTTLSRGTSKVHNSSKKRDALEESCGGNDARRSSHINDMKQTCVRAHSLSFRSDYLTEIYFTGWSCTHILDCIFYHIPSDNSFTHFGLCLSLSVQVCFD